MVVSAAGLPLPVAAAISNGLLFLLIGGMAGSCDADMLREKFTTKMGYKGILAGLVSQFVLLPLLGFLALTALPQSPATAIALLVVTTSPGGGFSGFWCFAANADLALSVAMTTASTLVSVVALPLNLALYITTLYGRTVAVDFVGLLTACVTVILAVATGYTLSRHFPRRRQLVASIGQTAGVCLMIFGALANGKSSDPAWGNDPSWFAAVCLPVVGGLLLAMLLALVRPEPEPETERERRQHSSRVLLHAPACGVSWAISRPPSVSCPALLLPPPSAPSRVYLRVYLRAYLRAYLRVYLRVMQAIKLPSPQAVAVGIECCYQNTGLALTIALSAMRPEDVGEASGVPIVYGLVEIILIPAFALSCWKLGLTYAPPEENVCKAIVGNYQPSAADTGEVDGSKDPRRSEEPTAMW